MKPKTLAILVVILAVLGGAVYLRQAQQTEVSIVEQVDLRTLAPEGVSAEAVDQLILYTGDRSERKVVLKKQSEDEWRVDSYHNSPATESKIDPFIDNVLTVRGEFRVTAPDADLATYGLADDQGFHIEGFTGNDKAFHVQVGKSANPSTVFMRQADSNDVFVTNATLKEDAGLWGQTEGMAASPDWWLDKSVLAMDTTTVTAIDLQYPDKHLRFERVAVETPSPETESETPDAEGEAEAEPADDPEPAAPTYEWKLVDGGLDKPLKPEAVDGILDKLAALTATTIVNPERKPDYSLDPPNFVATLEREGDDDFVIHGGRPEPRKGTYLTLPDSGEENVYNVSRWDFEALFPFGETLYDITPDSFDSGDVTRVALRDGDNEVVTELTDDGWRLVQPEVTLSADQYRPSDVAAAAASLTVKDYTNDPVGLGLDPALSEATFTTRDGTEYTYVRGIGHGSVDGHYARVSGVDFPVAVENSHLDSIFVGLGGLVDKTILSGILDTSIVGIDVESAQGAYAMQDNEMFWSVTVGAETFNADFDALEDYRYALTVLEATDVRIDPDYELPETAETITLARDDDSTITLSFVAGETATDPYTVVASNHPNLVFTVAPEAAGRSLVPAENFRPAPIASDAEPAAPVVEMPEHGPDDGHNH